MIELEKHIAQNRAQLDNERPRKGHEDRFLQKLQERQQPVRRIRFRHVLQMAASIAIILASAVVLIKQDRSGDKRAVEELPASFMEADQYYTRQVSERYEQIQAFDFESAEEKALLLDELKDLESYHSQLLMDLETHPGDEKVINALIRHYQVKLDIMDQIISQLNQLKTISNKQDENENV
jgi:hypothetical protein